MTKEKHKEIVGCKGESISEDFSKHFSSGDTEKKMYTEENLHGKEDVTGKSEFSETAAETREKGESFGQVVPKSLPIRQNISSTMLNFLWRKQKDHSLETQLRFSGNVRKVTKFRYSEIVKMTGSFGHDVWREGFWTVFKGILPDGQEVAVKVMAQPSHRGDDEFYKEMEVFKNSRHVNIIRFLGFCSEGRNRILVFEFMPKGSLVKLIHSEESSSFCPKHSEQLLEIAIGTARGVEYLHHGCDPPILHLDVKPSNIVLDEELRPKLTDFGTSHVYTDSSDLVSVIRGTLGFMDPDFAKSCRASRSTDVYSYGITLLEMALGRKSLNIHDESQDDYYILDWVRRRVSPLGEIQGVTLDETQRKMVIVGIWCTQVDPILRPLFPSIILMLEGSLDCLSLPSFSAKEKSDNGNEFGCDDNSISDASVTGR